MITKFEPANEPRFLCDVCSIAVTNPICPSCLKEEFEAWLTLYPDLRKELMPKMKRFTEWTEDQAYDATKCIKCNNKRATVCAYCFTEYVLQELKRLEVSKIVLREFFEFFNFDFDHTGYYNEAEKLGVF